MLQSLFSSATVPAVEAVGNILDKLFTSDEERGLLEQKKQELIAKAGEIQSEINKVEASHRSVFVAGWRPFIGWVCGFALLWQFMLADLLNWIGAIRGWPPMPALNGTSELVSIVVSLLGLSLYRTIEKTKGVSK